GDFQYARFVARGKRSDEGLACLHHRGEAGETLARQREPDVAIESQRDRRLRSLVDRRLRDRFPLAVEAPRLVGLEAEVEQLLALGRAQRIRLRAEHDRNEAPLAALGAR